MPDRSLHDTRVCALWPDVDETTLAASFADIDGLASQCRFRDCKHLNGETGKDRDSY